MKLREIAHSRTGDKGDISCLSLIVYDRQDYDLVARQVTPQRIAAWFDGIVKGEIERYELPELGALNIVMTRALGGGVTRSLSQDMHGKTLSSALLDMEIDWEGL